MVRSKVSSAEGVIGYDGRVSTDLEPSFHARGVLAAQWRLFQGRAAAGNLPDVARRRLLVNSRSNDSLARNRRDRREERRHALSGGLQPADRHLARRRTPPWGCR